MKHTHDSHNPANQKRLVSVIFLLIIIFAIWFGLLISGAQKDLKYISERMRSDTVIIKKRNPSNIINNLESGAVTTGILSSGGNLSGN